MADYNENDVKKNKKGYYLTINDDNDYQHIDLQNFKPWEGKGVKITASSSYDSFNGISSTLFNDTINIKKGQYIVYLNGSGTKKVTTGDDKVEIVIQGSPKTNIKTGNAENYFQVDMNSLAAHGSMSKNTIKAGNLKDEYLIWGGTNNITDKGGDNEFEIRFNSQNTIKTGSGADTFNLFMGAGGKTNIKSGDGNDTLNVTPISYGSWTTDELTADLGNGDDKVNIIHVENGSDAQHTNIKTGKGKDIVDIRAGRVNKIDTGNDDDTVDIYNGKYNFISTGKGVDTINIHSFYNKGSGNAEDDVYNSAISTIRAGKGDDIITVAGGENIIYGEAGSDNITITGGTNTVWADKDIINVDGGENTIKTSNGGNTINITKGIYTGTYLTKGANTVNISDTSTFIYVQNGNNTINTNGSSHCYFNDTNKKGVTTININGASAISGQLGSGVDKIIVNSTEDSSGDIHLGEGADTVTINSGSGNEFYGEKGKDIFYSYDGNNNICFGGVDIDKFYCYGGTNTFRGDEGNDIFYIEGGTANFQGGDGNDTFNINKGTQHNITGGSGNDIFNINIIDNGLSYINGQDGNDIYNLYKVNGSQITDNEGTNIFNVKKGYSGMTNVMATSSTSKIVLDKSYKLTDSKNVQKDSSNNDIVVTSDKSVTIFGIYMNGSFLDNSLGLMFNTQNEIADKDYTDNIIFNDSAEFYNIGGKNYKIDLTQLKSDLAAWFDAHDSYNSTLDVFKGTTPIEDINSLMAVYTKDTAECFIKA